MVFFLHHDRMVIAARARRKLASIASVNDDLVSPMSNVLDSAIYAVRKKITIWPGSAPLIRTRRGLGYVLES